MTTEAITAYITIVLGIAALAYAVGRAYDRHRSRTTFEPEPVRHLETGPGGTDDAGRELAWRSRTQAELRLNDRSAANRPHPLPVPEPKATPRLPNR